LSIIDLFYAGGLMMWPLLLCSIVGLAIIIVKFITLMMAGAESKKLLKQVNSLLGEEEISAAKELCEKTKGPVAVILLAGLKKVDQGAERVISAIENVGTIELSFLERGLVALATISTVAPLLGFLGTVAGMIQAFAAIEAYGEVDATLVAGGIKVALVTTATGLAIAIPVNIMHNYFVTRVDKMIIDMEESSENIVDTVYNLEQAKKQS
jgi:biopolymer transport protein ExbB